MRAILTLSESFMLIFFDGSKLRAQKRKLLNDSDIIFKSANKLKQLLKQQIFDQNKSCQILAIEKKEQVENIYKTDALAIEKMSSKNKKPMLAQLNKTRAISLSIIERETAEAEKKGKILLKQFNSEIDVLLANWDTFNRGANISSLSGPFSNRLHRYMDINDSFDINPICALIKSNTLNLDLNELQENNRNFLTEKVEHQEAIKEILKYQLYLESAGLAFFYGAFVLLIPIIIHALLFSVAALCFTAMTVVTLGFFAFVIKYTMAQQGRNLAQEVLTNPYHAYFGNILLIASAASLTIGAGLLFIASIVDSEPAFEDSESPKMESENQIEAESSIPSQTAMVL